MQVTVGVSGTGGGFERFCAGETDISNASRPIDDDEKAICEEKAVEYVEFQVANDALTVVVNRERLGDLPHHRGAQEDLGARLEGRQLEPGAPDFPDQKLKLFGPGTDSGTFDYFTDAINGEEGASRTDYARARTTTSSSRASRARRAAWATSASPTTRRTRTRSRRSRSTAATAASRRASRPAQDGTYTPLSRPLFVYAKTESLARPEVEAFVQYMLDNADSIAEEVQFVPLTDEQKQEALSAFDEAKGGSGSSGSETETSSAPAISAERPEIRLSGKRIRWGRS